MNIEITRPEVEALIQQRLRTGGFSTPEEMIFQALRVFENKPQQDEQYDSKVSNLSDLLLNSPFAGADLDLERSRDPSALSRYPMNGFLIDTNVLSEYNRSGVLPDGGVLRWLESTKRDLQFVSVITLAEIQKGIGLLAEGRRRSNLQHWLSTELECWFNGRILPIDRRVANRWAELLVLCSAKGRPIPSVDSLLAATALEHGLTLVTRNVKDFEGIGLKILNPWVS